MKKSSCFIITPIGDEHSSTRKRVDQWMTLIYEPVFGEKFDIIRADKISAPGLITIQVSHFILKSDLVIIDYTDFNPNVMYEAAVRHLAHKPFIQLCPAGYRLPFDIHNLRAIFYDPTDLNYPTSLKENLNKAYLATEEKDYKVPEILPQKFDLERIVSDPEKFIDILKEKLLFTKNDTILGFKDNISEVYESPFTQLSSAAIGILSRRVKCPKCGALQTFTTSPYTDPLYAVAIGTHKHYLCNICETEFE